LLEARGDHYSTWKCLTFVSKVIMASCLLGVHLISRDWKQEDHRENCLLVPKEIQASVRERCRATTLGSETQAQTLIERLNLSLSPVCEQYNW